MTAFAGCASYDHVSILVRDASTESPVQGAAVSVAPMKFFVPAWPYPTLNPAPHNASKAITDTAGRAALRIVSNGPSQVWVDARGYARFCAAIEPVEARGVDASSQWRVYGDGNGTLEHTLVIEVVGTDR